MFKNNNSPSIDLILGLAMVDHELPPHSGTNNSYYRSVLAKISQGKVFSWNWPAALFGILWLFYRRLYLWAFLIPVIVWPLIHFIFTVLTPLQGSWVFPFSWLIPSLFCGILGNWLYYQSLSHRVHKGYHLVSPPPTDGWAALFGMMFFPLALLIGFFKTVRIWRQIALARHRQAETLLPQ